MNCETLTVAEPTSFSRALRDEHPFCFVCSASNPLGLAVRFETEEDGAVFASFLAPHALEGYPGLLHGGLVAAMLDGAMTHCLFSRGIKALTAELQVRYPHPVTIGEGLTVRAWLESSRHGMHRLRAEVVQAGRVCARAQGKFLVARE